MNMIVGKKQIVLASLVVALGVAVYLNYQFAGEDLALVTANTESVQEISVKDEMEETENYGDAQFVDTKEVEQESTEASAQGDAEYFSQARLTRTKTRDEAAAALQVMLSDVELAQEQKTELAEQASALAQSIETEGKIENLIKAKGFQECMVYCSDEKVDVIVKSPELQQGDVVQIRDIILEQTEIPVENISIVPVK